MMIQMISTSMMVNHVDNDTANDEDYQTDGEIDGYEGHDPANADDHYDKENDDKYAHAGNDDDDDIDNDADNNDNDTERKDNFADFDKNGDDEDNHDESDKEHEM